jgi:hypothetical protein
MYAHGTPADHLQERIIMAKTNGPLFSMDASGKFAGALVFTKWKGRPVVRQLVTPANPMSTGQVTSRNRVRVGGAAQHFANLNTQLGNGRLVTDKAALITAAPGGFAWNGNLVDAMVGTGGLTYTAAAAAWTALTGGQKTAWDVAAAGLTPAMPAVVQKLAGNLPGTTLSAGNVFFLYTYGLYALAITTIPGAVPPVYA